MPYNNNPIPPSRDVTGTVSLPLARVKKIIATDDDVSACSNNAAFVMTVATEMFLQHLVEQSYNIVKSERKPRRNLQYRDVANAVARVENLEFLSDTVPRTMTYKQYKQQQAKAGGAQHTSGPISSAASGSGANATHGKGPMDKHVGQRSVRKSNTGEERESHTKIVNGIDDEEIEIDTNQKEEVIGRASNVTKSKAKTQTGGSDNLGDDEDEEGNDDTVSDERMDETP